MIFRRALCVAFAAASTISAGMVHADGGNTKRGAQVFRACAAFHGLEPGRNLTGPILAGVFGRKAGSLANFVRYSAALRHSGITWNERTLDAWLLGAGMRGDRAQVVFARPQEISAFIKESCTSPH